MDVQKELTLEETQQFFSKCGEYTVEKFDDRGSITLIFNDSLTDKECRTLIYRPTIQTLIRNISDLGWRSAQK